MNIKASYKKIPYFLSKIQENIKTRDKHVNVHNKDRDNSTKTFRKEWKRHFLYNRQNDASLITLTSCICNPMITSNLLMSSNWQMVININQWPAGTGILDLLDLPDHCPMEK